MQKYALLSVYDKTGITDFAKELVRLHYSIITTGGTAKVLEQKNIPFIPIQNITGNPESFDGRMKTISFQIESGILFDRSNQKHRKEAETLGIKSIDIVVCNLYPFEQTIAKQGTTLNEAVEQIDVGGPTMIRAAAKNFKDVVVVVDSGDYHEVIDYLSCHSELVSESYQNNEKMLKQVQHDVNKPGNDKYFRQSLAAKAFGHLAFYDSQIAEYLRSRPVGMTIPNVDDLFPNEITIPGRKLLDLRYGENPHQKASVYLRPGFNSSLQNIEKKWGRELSLINITDINAGIESVRLFTEPAAVVIKHNNPSGIALGKNAKEALERAIVADPESAFGGIVVSNYPMEMEAAKIISKFKDETQGNMDIIAVPEITPDALEFLQNIRKSMGIYTIGHIPKQADPWTTKWIDGGFILQTADNEIEKSFKDWRVVTKKQPTEQQLKQMQIAWKFISRIKSNSVIIVDKNLPMTRGIGSGQTSRVRATKLALEQAGKYCKNAILAGDSFFPFSDSVTIAAKYGIAAIVQQGGSIRDQDSIDAADKAGMVMIFTGKRAFWH